MPITLHIDTTFQSKERFLEWIRSALPMEDLGLEMGDSWDAFIEVLSCCAAEIDGGVHIAHSSREVFYDVADNHTYWEIVERDVPRILRLLGGSLTWSMTRGHPDEEPGMLPGG